MKKYLLKRILLIFVTLFGISLITFVITRIAPGDPATLKLQSMMSSPKSQPITMKMIEENRKMYGFDKPLLLNFRDKGKEYALPRLISDYLSETDPSLEQKYLKEIRLMNTIALPFILDSLKTLSPSAKQKELAITASSALELPNDSNLTLLNQTYLEKKELFKKEWIEQSIIRYFEKKDLPQKKNIAAAQAAAIPLLTQWIMSHKSREDFLPQIEEAVEILTSFTARPWKLNAQMNEKEKKNLYYSIDKFNHEYEEYFNDFSWFSKALRVFTDTQFGVWMGKITTLDFDISYAHKKPVMELIGERLPVTLQLNLISIFFIYVIALYLGIKAAVIHNSKKEKAMTLVLFILYSLPSFWIANLLILFFTGGDFLNWFPTQYLHSPNADSFTPFKYFTDWLWHLALPVIVLTYGDLAYLSRQMKASMLEVLSLDYIRTARAKGLPENKVIYSHALRNALIPIITLLGGLLPAMLGGSIIVEEIFSINGMGKLSFEAVINRDYPVINAIAFFSALLTLIGILISDLLYVLVDPRIKLEKEER